jgi:Bacteriophage tail sheath protein
MPQYLTPGIYRRPPPAERRDIAVVRTDVAGFVGFAERGPLPLPGAGAVDPKALAVRLTSWAQFLTVFGGYIPYGYLAYAVRAFFENGGTTCYVVRVAATQQALTSRQPASAAFALPDDTEPQDAGVLTLARGQLVHGVTGPAAIVAGDLLAVSGAGITEFVMVEAVPAPGRVQLARALSPHLPDQAQVLKYTTGIAVRAKSPGNWGNRLRLTVKPLTVGATVKEFALRVALEPGLDRTRAAEEENYGRLSLDPGSIYFAPDVVNSRSHLIQIEADAQPRPLRIEGGPVALGPVRLEGGRDGLRGIDFRDFTGGPDDLRGLRLLEEIDEVAILCVPDAVFDGPPVLPPRPPVPDDPCAEKAAATEPDPILQDPTAQPPALDPQTTGFVYRAMLDQCERLRDRVAVLDPLDGQTTREVVAWRDQFQTRFGALYYPWLKVPDPLRVEGLSRRVPPSGHVAGVYARIDNQFGVHRPPANAALEFITDVAEEISALQQEDLNPYGVNVLRSFQGRGIRVWGARSLAPRTDLLWRYIHARRLMSMIEESVEDSTQWAVFEPNDFALRRTLVHSLSVFLEAIWRQGGLKGALPAQGFYVKCDETNNPPAVTGVGRLVCEVGVAVAAPMEFLVFELHHKAGEANIVEV